MSFRTQIDWWMHGIFIGMTLIGLIGMYFYSFLAIAIGALLILWLGLYFNTKYSLEDDELVCQYGFFRQKVKYYNITTIEMINHFSISPALSVHRLALTQRNNGKRKAVLEISPKNREFFLSELQQKICDIKK